MILQILLTFVAALIGTIYLYFRHQFRFWSKHGFPHVPPTFPWGNASGMVSKKSIGQVVNDIYNAFPKERFVGLWFLCKPSLLIRDPDLVKSVLVKDFMTFHDRGIYVNEKDDPLFAHLISIRGSKWRNLRVKLTPTFTSGKLKMMFSIMASCSEKFTEILKEPAESGKVIEMKEYCARFTTDIISLAAFGLDTDSINHPEAEFRKYGAKIFELSLLESVKRFCQFLLPDVAAMFSLTTIQKDVSNFFLKVFKESMDYREENKIRRNDFMDLLIQLMNKGKLDDVDSDTKDVRKFTFEEAAAQAFVFFVAGFETSSTTMQFALYELAKNPEIQEKVREEINNVLAKHNEQVTYESINEMEYLGRVVDETLRLHTPIPLLQREAIKDYPIPESDLVLPKGSQIIVDCLSLHHDPTYYPEPEKFNPDRFTEKEKQSRHHYSYLPFGEGPRNCIGSRFGLIQTRVGLMGLLKNYEFSVAKETPIPMVLDPKQFITSPKGGMPLRISKVKVPK